MTEPRLHTEQRRALAMLATLCAEMGTLIDSNPGTIGTAATGIGGRRSVRTWS